MILNPAEFLEADSDEAPLGVRKLYLFNGMSTEGSVFAQIHVQSVASSERRLCNRLVSGAPNYDGPPILHFLRHLDSYLVDDSWFAHRRVDRAFENGAVVVLSHIRRRDGSVTGSALFTPDSRKLRPTCRRKRTGNVHQKSPRYNYNVFAMDKVATRIRRESFNPVE